MQAEGDSKELSGETTPGEPLNSTAQNQGAQIEVNSLYQQQTSRDQDPLDGHNRTHAEEEISQINLNIPHQNKSQMFDLAQQS